MGGKSSSSSSSTRKTYQYDERIAATDNAVVLRAENGGINYEAVDYGAIDRAGDLADAAVGRSLDNMAVITGDALNSNLNAVQEASKVANHALDSNTLVTETAISENSSLAREVVEGAQDLSTEALDAISGNAETAFQFVDKQRQDADNRLVRELVPWLVGGVSLVAITVAWRGS